MTLQENVVTFLILFSLALIGYLKFTNQTLPEFIRQLREVFSDSTEEVKGGLPK